MDAKTKRKLTALAKKYEVADFVNGDPSCILRRYKEIADVEVASFIMALLSFGQREQFLKKAETIFALCDNSPQHSPSEWLKSGAWQNDFPSGQKKFYRFYSFDDMRSLFATLQKILEQHETFGSAVQKKYSEVSAANLSKGERTDLASVIGQMFRGCAIVPQTTTSANKRVNMFLRWMVRTNSPVDLGLWQWFSPKNLVIPLDTHVLQVAKSLDLIPPKATGSAKTALLLTETLREVFSTDPVRADFALFGAGITPQTK